MAARNQLEEMRSQLPGGGGPGPGAGMPGGPGGPEIGDPRPGTYL